MKNLSCAVLAVALATSATFGQGQVELRLLSSLVTQDEGPVVIDTGGLVPPFAMDVYLQARIVDDPDAVNILALGAFFEDGPELPQVNDAAGSFTSAAITYADLFPDVPGAPGTPAGYSGLFPRFSTGVWNDVHPCPCGGLVAQGWSIEAVDLNPPQDGDGPNVWSSIYKARWTTHDLDPREVSLHVVSRYGGYVNSSGATIVALPSFDSMTLVFRDPACVADLDVSGAVDVFDLLAYLDLWFAQDPDADRTGGDPPLIDVLDLLAYLTDWFGGVAACG